jgi:hypothetical protein
MSQEFKVTMHNLPGAPATRNTLGCDRGKSSYLSRFCDGGGVAKSKSTVGAAAKCEYFTGFVKEQRVHASTCDLPDLARCKSRYRERYRTLINCALTELAVPDACEAVNTSASLEN